jgi:hypothetical protein
VKSPHPPEKEKSPASTVRPESAAHVPQVGAHGAAHSVRAALTQSAIHPPVPQQLGCAAQTLALHASQDGESAPPTVHTSCGQVPSASVIVLGTHTPWRTETNLMNVPSWLRKTTFCETALPVNGWVS